MRVNYYIAFFLLLANMLQAQKLIVVDASGGGDFKTIQSAINSLPKKSTEERKIFIKQGIYNEKIFIEKQNLILEGENKSNTIITQSIARDEWRCSNSNDWGVATMNVGENDITLINLTIQNVYGFETPEKTIPCANDTSNNQQKKIKKDGHQMALRVMKDATRLKALNCHFKAYGGDTVSPWEVNNGMWYFKNCIMEGGVDFYCPRGWAWAEDCEFIVHTGQAAIWHDGSANKESKTILVNCVFKGYDGFMLGRYHRDAQFYLINCVFAKNMKDAAIYRVPTNNTIQWGHRVYFFNCKREGGNDFNWYKNNLPDALDKKSITTEWLFGNRWNPKIHANAIE